jgi:SnoaL-like domain
MKNFALAAALAIVSFVVPSQATEPGDPQKQLQILIDEAYLRRIATEIETAVDRKDWIKARSFFADQVRADFTSLVGGEPATIPADALIQGWSGNLKGNKESLHMRGDVLITIDGDKATVNSNGYAYNKMPGATDGSGDVWEVWGRYTHNMTRTESGWKVDGFTFVKTYERGSMWVKNRPGS